MRATEGPRSGGRPAADIGAAAPPISPTLEAFLNARGLIEGGGLSRAGDGTWLASARLGADCSRLHVYLDHSAYTTTRDGERWAPHERLLLATRLNLSRGEELSVRVLAPAAETTAGWSWCKDDSDFREPAALTAPARGRLAFSYDGHTEQMLYFVLIWPAAPAGRASEPILVDETHFGFKDAWEAEAPLAHHPRWRGR